MRCPTKQDPLLVSTGWDRIFFLVFRLMSEELKKKKTKEIKKEEEEEKKKRIWSMEY